MKVSGICLSYVERYFQAEQWKSFFFRAQITLILLLLRMLVSQRSQRSEIFSRIFSAMEFLSMCVPLSNKVIPKHQWNAFFFRAQISQILLFFRMLVLGWWKITVWERHLFHTFFCYGSFWHVSTLRKKLFSGAPVKNFFL